jgi:hypothetical protein
MTVKISNVWSNWANSSNKFTGFGLHVNATAFANQSNVILVDFNGVNYMRLDSNGYCWIYDPIAIAAFETANAAGGGGAGIAIAAFLQANTAYNQANNAYVRANGAWTQANSVGTSGNLYAVSVGNSGNLYAQQVGTAGNNYAITMDTAGNLYSEQIGTAGNNFHNAIHTAQNLYSQQIGTAGNLVASALATAGNAYTANAFSVANNAYTNAIAAFAKANTGSGSSVNVGDTTPPENSNGALWWDTEVGRLFIYYYDGDSGQWVEASPASNGSSSSSVDAFNQANAAFNQANAAYDTANAAGGGGVAAAFNQANAAYNQANAAFNQANTGSGSVNVGGTTPPGTSNGALWWDINTGTLYIYYNDGDSSQWVPASPVPSLTADATPFNQANTAYNQANAAYQKANVEYNYLASQTGAAANLNFTNIPANANCIELLISDLSVNVGTVVQVQVGSGGINTTGYRAYGSVTGTGYNYATGFPFLYTTTSLAAYHFHGKITIDRFTGNTYVATGTAGSNGVVWFHISGGSVNLNGPITDIRISASSITNWFDAGSVVVRYS